MKILITGGCGYIGFELVQRLLKQEEVELIRLYDNLSSSNLNFFISTGDNVKRDIVEFVQGDLLDGNNVRKALNGIDFVFHFAATVSTPFSDALTHTFDQVNHWGSSILVDAIREADGVKKIIYLSSISVYGNTDGQMVDEDDTVNPFGPYGKSKYRAEKQMLRLIDEKDLLILRAGNVYGINPCMKMNGVINRFLFDATYDRRILIHGDGNQYRPFIFIDTLVDKLIEYIESKPKGLKEHISNVVEHNSTINEIKDYFLKEFADLEWAHVDQHLSMRSLQVNSKYISFEEKVDFKERFRRLASKYNYR